MANRKGGHCDLASCFTTTTIVLATWLIVYCPGPAHFSYVYDSMDHHMSSNDGPRRKARQRLEALLRTPGKSAEAAASEAETIVNLAYLVGDPVRDLFLSTNAAQQAGHPQSRQPTSADGERSRTSRPAERTRSVSPAETIRPAAEPARPKSSHKSFFKFGRARDKAAAAAERKPASGSTPAQEGVTELFEHIYGPVEPKKPKRKASQNSSAQSASSSNSSKAPSMTSSFCSAQKPNRLADVVQYTCIVCDAELSSKGVCKRHLMDQHITPQVYECECCHAHFDTKPDAKKHCMQCGSGDYHYFPTKLAKKVYACEYSGSYFGSLQRYIDFLLPMCERKPERPKRNLNLKLDAIMRYTGQAQLCDSISQRIYGDPECWRTLVWKESYLLNVLSDLEHATFHPDGTMESTKWTGSTPKLHDTELYLIRLMQDGDRRGLDVEAMLKIKQEPSSTFASSSSRPNPTLSMLHMQNSLDTPHGTASPASIDRSHSRQTMWSQDSVEQATSATTPRSVPASEEVLSAEVKGKRHLSDQSRAYVPARTPPGPPEPPEQYQYKIETPLPSEVPQLPPLPAFMTPSSSTMSLPLRKPEGHDFVSGYQTQVPYMNTMYQGGHSTFTLASDVESETSTLAQSYHEPELGENVPMDYNFYMQQLGYENQPGYGYPNLAYTMPDDRSSIATGNTIVDHVTEISKIDGYAEMPMYPSHGPGQTFYFEGNEQQQQQHHHYQNQHHR